MSTQGPDTTPLDSASVEHARVRELLPEYATMAALGSAPSTEHLSVASHIQTCHDCRAVLDDLLALTRHAFSGQVEPARIYPPFDLSFLAPAAPTERPGPLDRLAQLVITFSEELLATLRQPTVAGALRGQLLYRYTQSPNSAEDLDLRIEVFAEDGAHTTGRVQVIVDVPSCGALDQSGSHVLLRAGDEQRSGETDEAGCVDFNRFPLSLLPQLRIEITPKQKG